MKNRFWRFQKRFSLVFTCFLSVLHHPTLHSEPLYIANGLHLESKWSTVATQMEYCSNANGVLLKGKRSTF